MFTLEELAEISFALKVADEASGVDPALMVKVRDLIVANTPPLSEAEVKVIAERHQFVNFLEGLRR